MRLFFFIFLTITTVNIHAQYIEYDINWIDGIEYEIDNNKVYVPQIENFENNYSFNQSYSVVKQWKDSQLIDINSIRIVNAEFSNINIDNFSGLKKINFPQEIEFYLNTSISRNEMFSFLEITPIIFQNGVYKKLIKFAVEYKYLKSRNIQKSIIQPSVMKNGNWYKFYVENTGIHKIDKDFLEDLGINTSNLDPRKLKIYGHGGSMLPMLNSDEFPIDPFENSIKFMGQNESSFNNEDYILFYAQGPTGFNSESNTNLNLYEDRASYFISVGQSDGQRIFNYSEPNNSPDLIIDYYTNYQFHEIDQYNIAQIGRRWFGDRFDFENTKTFEFNIQNLRTDLPIDFKIYTAATSEIPTSMSVRLNGQQLTNLYFGSIGEPILATGSSYQSQVNSQSEIIDVTLDYNNNGNPSSIAYLDYISLKGTSSLVFNDSQLIFYNDNLITESDIVSYQIDNSENINAIWDISNISNISEIIPESSNNFSFNSAYSPNNKFIAFNYENVFEPVIDGQSQIENQNLKEDIFLDESGLIQAPNYIIISNPDMIFQAERLAQINSEKNNLNVKVVNVEKIYNEFSSGNQDISAIRNFIRYVYNNQNNNENFTYLCLFGDASFDYKDRIPFNTNIIPSWNSLNSFSLSSSYISDDFFGMMDSNEGGMTNFNKLDIAVGRILADSNERARDLVDKIESYYSESSFGDWRNKIMVISDDVDEPWENIIQSTSNDIADLIQENKPFFNTSKILSDAFQQETSSGGERYPEVKNQIINGIKKGALVVNYFGHGGEDGIARERIFGKIDAAELVNSDKLNCFVSVTCEFTKFDNPNRQTAGEFLYWNKNGGAIALITTTRQIFVSVGVNFNLTLEEYLFSLNSDTYTTMAEALRLTKIDPSISNSDQRRLVFFIGDPAMKLSIPKPDVKITSINDVPIQDFDSSLRGLDLINVKGEVQDDNGLRIESYQGELTATVFDKEIERSTLGNDGTTDNSGNPIILNFYTLGEVLFRGKSSVLNGSFEFNFVVPKDVGMEVDNGKFSFYSKQNSGLEDRNGYDLSVLIGGINENAQEDNIGPEIDLYMNDESFISGGITNENPNLIVKLFDENGINTSSGVGHDIIAVLDNDDVNSYRLNEYYQADLDDYKNGTINFPFNNLTPGVHNLRLKAWDVYNNSSETEIDFLVFDQNEDIVIENLLNYPNPFINFTEFWFNHNSSNPLNVTIQIFTISGRLVKTINGITQSTSGSNFSRDFSWDGRDDFGDKVAKGVYIYKINVRSETLNKQVSKTEKLVIL